MDLFFFGFNPNTVNLVTISPLAGFTYLLVCIWLGLLLTRPEK